MYHQALSQGLPSQHIIMCRYEVRKKKAKFAEGMEDIATLINDKFVDRMGKVNCGIVYCLSKADCEKVAEQLQSAVDSLPPKQGRSTRCKIKYGPLVVLNIVCCFQL